MRSRRMGHGSAAGNGCGNKNVSPEWALLARASPIHITTAEPRYGRNGALRDAHALGQSRPRQESMPLSTPPCGDALVELRSACELHEAAVAADWPIPYEKMSSLKAMQRSEVRDFFLSWRTSLAAAGDCFTGIFWRRHESA